MKVQKRIYRKLQDNKEIYEYTLDNGIIILKTINYGGIVTSLLTPDKYGNHADIVLGFDNLEQYVSGHPYFGAIIGRFANRIADGKFTLNGEEYSISQNNEGNALHGGFKGFDKAVWYSEIIEEEGVVGIRFEYISNDGEEGFPGKLKCIVEYVLDDKNEFIINYHATTNKPTIVNLTHHSYFNLTGCKESILGHRVKLFADKYTESDESLIPTGRLLSVENTPFDFRTEKEIKKDLQLIQPGYDHNFILKKSEKTLEEIAEVYEPASGRTIIMYTTEPGVQFYTGNFLDGSIKGKNGIKYEQYYGLCLEAQHFPDSPNQPSFPPTLLNPGETYTQQTIYKFSIK